MSDYITTYSNIDFYPVTPNKDDILIEDIAHSLSMLCRANGHYSAFYSVGAHCLNCYDEACARRESNRVKMACLLHDATESYLSDVTRPVKQFLDEYIKIENNLASLIYEKFLGSDLTDYEKSIVKIIDDAMLYYEFYEFGAKRLFDEPPYVAATPDFYKGDMRQVEQKYLDVFNSIDLTEIKEEKFTIKFERKNK